MSGSWGNASFKTNDVLEIDNCDKKGRTQLHHATIGCSLEDVQKLLKNGANPNIKDRYGRTALNFAVEINNLEIVTALLENGADPNLQNEDGKTSLHLATIKRDSEILAFEENSCDNNQFKKKKTLGCFTAEKCDKKVVSALLDNDANRDNQFDDWKTSIYIEGRILAEEFFMTLQEDRDDIDVQEVRDVGYLYEVIAGTNLSIIKSLLSHDTKVNIQDIYGRTALHLATKDNNLEVIKELLNGHANPDIRDVHMQTPLHIASMEKSYNPLITKVLLEKNAKVNIRDTSGFTPLHYAVIHENLAVISNLLDHGANPDIQCRENHWTPLYHAIKKGNLEFVSILLKYNSNNNIQDKNGRTPLWYAIDGDDQELTLSLLRHGADVNICDNEGQTALHYAAEKAMMIIKDHLDARIRKFCDIRNNKDRVKLKNAVLKSKLVFEALLDTNADVNIRDKNGRTPLHCCRYYYQTMLQQYVRKLRAAKLYVCEENLSIVDNNTNEWHLEELKAFENLCETEISVMNSQKIANNSVSFYEFMIMGTHTRAHYLNNQTIVDALKLIKWKEKFPLYGNILKCRFTEAVKRNELLQKARLAQGTCIFQNLPDICLDKVSSYLENYELKYFIYVLQS